MNSKAVLCALIATMTLFSGILPALDGLNQERLESFGVNVSASRDGPEAEYTVRDPIRINGDADFTAENGVSNPEAEGTLSEPFIIDGWEIDGTGSGRCIYIGNTTRHFVIRNCKFHNASGDLFNHNPGIVIFNAGNGTVEGTVIRDCTVGILLYDITFEAPPRPVKVSETSVSSCDYGIVNAGRAPLDVSKSEFFDMEVGVRSIGPLESEFMEPKMLPDLDEGGPIFVTSCDFYNAWVAVEAAWTEGSVIRHCNFENVETGVLNYDHDPAYSVDARENYWGAADGPSGAGPGSGAAASVNSFHVPYLLEARGSPSHGPLTDFRLSRISPNTYQVELYAFDPDGTIISFEWDMGDGTKNTADEVFAHEYASEGIYMISLEVTDDDMNTRTHSRKLAVGKEPLEPIAIYSDQMFDAKAAQNGWAGSGTPDDPYVIWNVDIMADTRDALHFENCPDTHFVIEDSYIHGEEDWYTFQSESPVGVSIENCGGTQVRGTLFEDFNNAVWVMGDDGTYVFYGNSVTGTRNWLQAMGPVEVYASSNDVTGADMAISLVEVEAGSVCSNQFTDCDTAVHAERSKEVEANHNNIEGSRVGMMVFEDHNETKYKKAASQNNWWGDATGPSGEYPGMGAAAVGAVEVTSFSPMPREAKNTPPIARIYGPGEALVGAEVEFKSTSYDSDGKIARQTWEINGVMVSVEKAYKHTFSMAGTYTINLTVWDEYGEAGNDSLVIEIKMHSGPPNADFTYSPESPFTDEYITFADASEGNIVKWSWNFGDGRTSQETDPVHFYTDEGTYNVMLTVTNEIDQLDSASKSVTVTKKPKSVLRGFLTDETTGEPIKNAKIKLTEYAPLNNTPTYEVTTDENGYYEIELPANCENPYSDRTTHVDYLEHFDYAPFLATGSAAWYNFTMRKNTGVIQGYVKDEQGDPILQADVAITQDGNPNWVKTRTDPGGYYSQKMGEDTDLVVKIQKEGFSTFFSDGLLLLGGQVLWINATLTREVGDLAVTVLGGAGGDPEPDAYVRIDHGWGGSVYFTGFTDSNGEITWNDIPAGPYSVYAEGNPSSFGWNYEMTDVPLNGLGEATVELPATAAQDTRIHVQVKNNAVSPMWIEVLVITTQVANEVVEPGGILNVIVGGLAPDSYPVVANALDGTSDGKVVTTSTSYPVLVELQVGGWSRHSTISASGNAAFAAMASAEGWEGSGTPSNPIVIESYIIDCQDSGTRSAPSPGGRGTRAAGHGIYIENVDLHFVIRDCYINNGGGSFDGIFLFNVRNATIEGARVTGCRRGVTVYASEGIVIRDSLLFDNAERGISIDWSSHILVDRATLTGNDFGFRLEKSTGVSLHRCNITGNGQYGGYNHDSADAAYAATALLNWWGHPYGPYNPDANAVGYGNNVSTNIDFTPWLEGPCNGSNLAPVLSFTHSPEYSRPGEDVQFNDTSLDVDGEVVSWLWEFGDGNSSTSQNPTHAYEREGIYRAKLTVTDDQGLESNATADVEISHIVKHGPIYAWGNEEFETLAATEGWAGTGIEADPYIIENYRFDTTEGVAVSLNYVTFHVLVRNCIIKGPGSGTTAGVHLYYCQNIQIEDSFVTATHTGINIQDSQDVYIARCLMEDSINAGVRASNSEHVWITACHISGGAYGIYQGWGSEHLTAHYNNIVESTSYGIYNIDWEYAPSLIDARHNWWGHESGPYHEASNPGGQGSAINNGVTYNPFSEAFFKDRNIPPAASFEVKPGSPKPGQLASFNDTSFDPDGEIVSWMWDFGDGNTSTLRNATHAYEALGDYNVTLTVRDDGGASSSSTKKVTVTWISPHATILIDGNEQLLDTASYEGWAGTGAAGDPIVIRDYDINASAAHGIYIKNTDLHVAIVNCRVHHGGNTYYGIYLQFIQNVVVDGCGINNNHYGINSWSATNIQVRNSTFTANYYGIYYYATTYSDIDGNIFTETSSYQIEVYSNSHYVNVTNNTMGSNINLVHGIYLRGTSHYPRISNNTISGSGQDGINIAGSQQPIIENNTVYASKRHGMYVNSLSPTVKYNTIYDNGDVAGEHGISLYYSSASSAALIFNNVIHGHFGYGIHIYNYPGSTILKNRIYNNLDGIYMTGSNNPRINENTIYNHRYGIYFSTIQGTVARNNSISDSTTNGMYTSASASYKVDAAYNWWGDATGPYEATLNPTGQGDSLSNSNFIIEPFLTIEPILKPVYKSKIVPSEITTGDASVFTVAWNNTMAARDAVTSAWVSFWNGTTDFATIQMIKLDHENWTAEFTAPENFTGNVSYRFFALCDAGEENQSAEYKVFCRDDDAPTAWDVSTIYALNGTEFLFRALISDNIGIAHAWVNHTLAGGTYMNAALTFDGINWTAIITPDVLGAMECRVFAVDASGNIYNTTNKTITVTQRPFFTASTLPDQFTADAPSLVKAAWGFEARLISVTASFTGQNASKTVKMYSLDGENWYAVVSVPGFMVGNVLVSFTAVDANGMVARSAPVNRTVADMTPPTISDLSPTTGIGGYNYVWLVNVTDNFKVDSVYVNAVFPGQSMVNLSMIYLGNGQWTRAFPLQESTHGEMTYVILANDTSDNWAKTPEALVFINDKPTLAGSDFPPELTTGDSFEFKAVWKDAEGGVESAWIVFSTGPTVLANLSMTSADGENWSAQFDVPSGFTGTLSYRCYANDTYGIKGWSPVYEITSRDDDAPLITDTSNTAATTGDQFQFSALASDNVGISEVRVIYWLGSNEAGAINTSMALSAGTWEHDIVIPSNSLDELNYVISARDAAGNWNSTVPYAAAVSDNDAPAADAGMAVAVEQGNTVHFNGSASSDNIGITNFTWNFTYDGSPVLLYGEMASFTFDAAGVYTVTLTVRDTADNRGTDTMVVTVSATQVQDTEAPVAATGSDVNVYAGNIVHFDGSGSTDNVGIVNWTWTFMYDGVEMKLYGENPEFAFDIAGVYTITLKVTDGAGNSAEDVMTLRVVDPADDTELPIAVTGPDQRVTLSPSGEVMVTFDGRDSTDNVEVANWTWTFTYNGVEVKLYGPMPSFVFSIPGVYVITLNVTDGAGLWTTDTFTVTVGVQTPEEDRGTNAIIWLLLVVLIVLLFMLVFVVFSEEVGSPKKIGEHVVDGMVEEGIGKAVEPVTGEKEGGTGKDGEPGTGGKEEKAGKDGEPITGEKEEGTGKDGEPGTREGEIDRTPGATDGPDERADTVEDRKGAARKTPAGTEDRKTQDPAPPEA